MESLFFEFDGIPDFTRRFVHRHAALVVDDTSEIEQKLKDHGIEVLFSGNSPAIQLEGSFESVAVQGWIRMYGSVPVFCLDPFGNLLEFVPGTNLEVSKPAARECRPARCEGSGWMLVYRSRPDVVTACTCKRAATGQLSPASVMACAGSGTVLLGVGSRSSHGLH